MDHFANGALCQVNLHFTSQCTSQFYKSVLRVSFKSQFYNSDDKSVHSLCIVIRNYLVQSDPFEHCLLNKFQNNSRSHKRSNLPRGHRGVELLHRCLPNLARQASGLALQQEAVQQKTLFDLFCSRRSCRSHPDVRSGLG